MYRAYEVWKSFAMLVVKAVFAYVEKADDWGVPPVVIMVLPVILLVAAELILPRWLLVSLSLVIALPMIWYLGSLFYTHFELQRSRDRR